MPGVLIVEALAQVGAVAILSEEGNKGRTAYFGAVSYTHLDVYKRQNLVRILRLRGKNNDRDAAGLTHLQRRPDSI